MAAYISAARHLVFASEVVERTYEELLEDCFFNFSLK